MKVCIPGVGVWARGISGFADLCQLARGGELPDVEFSAPKPEAISARERRRAGLTINLAVAVAHEACEVAGVDKAQVPSVFASAMGDTEITDYMCRKLSQGEKLLSPTKFHNSVHNAPSGYWSISAENRAPSTFVAGYRESFGAGLLEAVSQMQATQQPVLLVAYDIQDHAPLEHVTPIAQSLACALVVAPHGWAQTHTGALSNCAQIALVAGEVAADSPQAPGLVELADGNPMGVGLALLERLVAVQDGDGVESQVCVPAAARLWLDVRLGSGPSD
jgi:hypothetical protein